MVWSCDCVSIEREQWQMGSLSHMLNSQANGYKPLPNFPEEPPDPSVRNVEVCSSFAITHCKF